MKELSVIIPSATLVPKELQNLGKLPGIIYPINQRIVFDYLYEQYKNISGTIDVICYEAHDKVRAQLSVYTDKKIRIKVLHGLKDLGHTIYTALENISSPVMINFADTIVMDDIFCVNGDTVFYSEDYLSDTWTFFEMDSKGCFSAIYDKEQMNSEEKKRLFVGVFFITDPEMFRSCLINAFETSELNISTFYYALYLYSRKKIIQAIKVNNWFDIGHADTYYNSSLEVRARTFNHISVDKDRGILRKTSDDKEKFIGEIMWYLKLPSDIEYVRPRVFSYSTSYNNPYVEMEYYAYHTVHELFLYGDLSSYQWREILQHIRFVCMDFKRYSLQDDMIKTALRDMYLTKTSLRLEKLKKNKSFDNFYINPITINGIRYCSLNKVEKILNRFIPKMLCDIDRFYIIHGDLCFANIMIDNNLSFIKLIDPRGSFGRYDIYGDIRYELAKLFHSIDGKYDFIIKDLFSVEYNLETAEITYVILDRKRKFDIYKLFLSVFEDEIGADLKKIELIEALLFLSMVPLHSESLEHQMVMLGTGLEILNRVIDITNPCFIN